MYAWLMPEIKGDLAKDCKTVVVIPAFKVTKHIDKVVRSVISEVSKVIVIDDACPEGSGKKLLNQLDNNQVEVIFHDENRGVGGAVKTGYKRALELEADIIIKLDGDGQMDPANILTLVEAIREEKVNYAKGNRFYEISSLEQMPRVRIAGNLILTLLTKLSSGYWRIFDPANGFTAIDGRTLKKLPLDKIDNRYFFESDMLFRLRLANAVVADVPMKAKYGDEISNVSLKKVFFEFPVKYARNFFKRVFYLYYLRDFNLASIQLPIGVILFFTSIFRGLQAWIHSNATGIPTSAGTVVFCAILFLSGLQLILSFLNFDIENYPKKPIKKG